MTQVAMWHDPGEAAQWDKDSWSSPDDVMRPVHQFWPGGISLDPCSNAWAQALGFVRARTAWTIRDNCLSFHNWDVEPGRTTVWLQPPYSRDGAPIIEHWAKLWDEGQMHETLALVRVDTSTGWWATLSARSSSLCFFKDRLDHYEEGTKKTGSNFCSAMFLATREDPKRRHRTLERAFGERAWVYR